VIDWRNIVVVDTETTGPNPFVHDLLSLAMVPLNRSLPELILHVSRRGAVNWNKFARKNFQNFRTLWTQDAVDVQIAFRQVQEYLVALNLSDPIVFAGHNVGFDRAFLQKLAYLSGHDFFPEVTHRTLDTHTLLYERVLRGILPESCLTSSGAFEFFGIEPKDADRHTAIGDAIATRDLLELLLMPVDSSIGVSDSLGRFK